MVSSLVEIMYMTDVPMLCLQRRCSVGPTGMPGQAHELNTF